MSKTARIIFILFLMATLAGCAHQPGLQRPETGPVAESQLSRMEYSIQVGAFSILANAVRLMGNLQKLGLEAYYFKDRDNLYKVRFGNYPSYQAARKNAELLQGRGSIQRFFVVVPESYSASRIPIMGKDHVRNEIVKTARGFIGIPYRWGGTSEASGFDCSGLTMVVYRQNGLNLPRVSRNQFQAGRGIHQNSLQKGDLVFFATSGKGQVSHVGIYIGQGKFIHAPASGRRVSTEYLSSPYFRSRFVGARTYL
ncbi:MAG: NlpC/P60 family protein [Desulfonatronovibrio sp.]